MCCFKANLCMKYYLLFLPSRLIVASRGTTPSIADRWSFKNSNIPLAAPTCPVHYTTMSCNARRTRPIHCIFSTHLCVGLCLRAYLSSRMRACFAQMLLGKPWRKGDFRAFAAFSLAISEHVLTWQTCSICLYNMRDICNLCIMRSWYA